jgi:hypothetical protein
MSLWNRLIVDLGNLFNPLNPWQKNLTQPVFARHEAKQSKTLGIRHSTDIFLNRKVRKVLRKGRKGKLIINYEL